MESDKMRSGRIEGELFFVYNGEISVAALVCTNLGLSGLGANGYLAFRSLSVSVLEALRTSEDNPEEILQIIAIDDVGEPIETSEEIDFFFGIQNADANLAATVTVVQTEPIAIYEAHCHTNNFKVQSGGVLEVLYKLLEKTFLSVDSDPRSGEIGKAFRNHLEAGGFLQMRIQGKGLPHHLYEEAQTYAVSRMFPNGSEPDPPSTSSLSDSGASETGSNDGKP